MNYRGWLIVFLLTAAAPAGADDWWAKMQACRFNGHQLIGISHDALIKRCGMFTGSSTMTTAAGFQQVATYGNHRIGGPFFQVLMINGIVRAVQNF